MGLVSIEAFIIKSPVIRMAALASHVSSFMGYLRRDTEISGGQGNATKIVKENLKYVGVTEIELEYSTQDICGM